METMKSLYHALLILSLMMVPNSLTYAQIESQDQEEEGSILIGHISHIEGELLRYVPEEEDWAPTVKDTPFAIDDVLYATLEGRAEVIMPNNTWARIDGDTQIQLVLLNKETTEIDLSLGKARLYNKSSDTMIKATTHFGYVMVPPETTFDLYVGENVVKVIALKGTVYFVHNSSDTRYEVTAGSSSVFAYSTRVTASEGHISPGWDGWNRDRDILWAETMRATGESASYLPPALHDEAYVLENYGQWERVFYDDAYYSFWRPVCVGAGWAPFTVGRWSVWHGDKIWIPQEPFGYVTHHYGNWIFTRGYWYWAPPVTRRMLCTGLPLLDTGSCWYPGRVAWIHYGANVGWIPLAPYEPYYCNRYWGRRSIAVASVRSARYRLNTKKYKHHRRAVIIHRNHYLRANNYENLRIRNIPHTTVNRYCAVPVINKMVVNKYRTRQKRDHFSNAPVTRKPNKKFIKRINRRNVFTRKTASIKTGTIRGDISHSSWRKQAGNSGIRSPNYQNRVGRTKQIGKANVTSKFKGKTRESKAKFQKENPEKSQRQKQKARKKNPPNRLTQKSHKWEDQQAGKKQIQKTGNEKAPGPVRDQYPKLRERSRVKNKTQKVQKKRHPKPVKPQLVKWKHRRGQIKEAKQRLAKKSALPDRKVQNTIRHKAEGRGQKTDVGGRTLEGRQRTTEIRGQRTNRVGQSSGIRWRKSAGRRRTTENRRFTAVFTGNAKR